MVTLRPCPRYAGPPLEISCIESPSSQARVGGATASSTTMAATVRTFMVIRRRP